MEIAENAALDVAAGTGEVEEVLQRVREAVARTREAIAATQEMLGDAPAADPARDP
jgi:hypothetical protein